MPNAEIIPPNRFRLTRVWGTPPRQKAEVSTAQGKIAEAMFRPRWCLRVALLVLAVPNRALASWHNAFNQWVIGSALSYQQSCSLILAGEQHHFPCQSSSKSRFKFFFENESRFKLLKLKSIRSVAHQIYHYIDRHQMLDLCRPQIWVATTRSSS